MIGVALAVAAAVAGTPCRPVSYNGTVCAGTANWNIDAVAQDNVINLDLEVSKLIGPSQLISNATCVRSLLALACGATYPQCLTNGGTSTLVVPCKDSCNAALSYCKPVVAAFNNEPLNQKLVTSVQNCESVSETDTEPLGVTGSCLDTNQLAGIGVSTGGILNVGKGLLNNNQPAVPTPSIGNLTCPSFFLQQTGENNKNCRDLGNGIRCCVPCPVQNYFYPNNQFDVVVLVTQVSSVVSALLAGYVVLSWSVLPGRRQHPGDIVLHFTIAVMLWQACAVFLIGNPRRIQCADEVTISTASNNLLCGIQGALVMCAVHAAVMWGGYMMFNLHATIVWRSNFFERYKPLGVTLCWGLPGVLTFIPFFVSQVDAVTGVTCIISAEKGNLFFFSFQAVVIIPAFILNTSTMIHIMIVARRQTAIGSSNVSGGYSSTGFSGNGEKPVSARRQMLHLLKLNWRALCLGLLFIVTYVTYVAFFNTVVVPIATTDASTPWVLEWVLCNSINDPTNTGAARDSCAKMYASNIPSFSLALTSAFIVSTIGLWIFFIFGFNMQLIYDWMNWFEDLRHLRTRRRAQDVEPEWR